MNSAFQLCELSLPELYYIAPGKHNALPGFQD